MPENVQNQTIFDVIGYQIPESEIPFSNDRIFRYVESCCTIPYWHKRASELLDYNIDLRNWLESREEVIGVKGWCEPTSLIMTRLEFTPTNVVAWLVGGEDRVRYFVNLLVTTSKGRVKLIQFVVQTFGTTEGLVFVTVDNEHALIGSRANGWIPEPEPLISAFPSTLIFPPTAVGQEAQKTVILQNTGRLTAFIRRYEMDGPFHQTNSGQTRLEPGQFIQLNITYKPTTTGSHTGSIQVDIGEGLEQCATLQGTSF